MSISKVVLLLTFLSITVSISFPTHSFNISQNVCEYIASDDKKRLRALLKTNRLKIRGIFKDVLCNDMNILIFAAKRNANQVGSLIIKKLPKSVLKEQIADLEAASADLATKAKERAG